MTEDPPEPQTRPVAAQPATPAELKRLYEERKELNARIRAAKSKAKKDARTLRNRHGILTGLAILGWLDAHPNPALAEQVQRARDWWLKKPDERALFGLPPLLEIVTPARKDRTAEAPAAPADSSASAPPADDETRKTEVA